MCKNWNEYFMETTEIAASRSTCDRAFVGCVLVNKDHRIVSIGYNESVAGSPHCSEVGHTMRDGHRVATIHVEVNAFLYCAKEGIPVKGCTTYVTHFPYLNRSRTLVQADIKRIYYKSTYRADDYALDLSEKNGIHLEQINLGQEG